MYHSLFITKGDTTINTWANWYLIPSSRPVVAQPTMAEKYVEIPGMDGSLDLTDYLTQTPSYSDRKGTWEFYVMNGYGSWEARRADIASYLDGSKMRVMLEDDLDNYYVGRVILKEWRSEPQFSKVVFEYHLNPYKYSMRDGKAAL